MVTIGPIADEKTLEVSGQVGVPKKAELVTIGPIADKTFEVPRRVGGPPTVETVTIGPI